MRWFPADETTSAQTTNSSEFSARAIMGTPKYLDITPKLHTLQWLPLLINYLRIHLSLIVHQVLATFALFLDMTCVSS